MSGSSKMFEQNPPTEPKWSDDEGDPYARMDTAEKAKQEMIFVNFYQLKQFANLFSSIWGLILVTQGTQFKCFLDSSSAKKRDPVVSPSRQRDKQSMKSNCSFLIKASEHLKKRQEAKHQKPVRITEFELDHDDCNPSV
jgi:hypothetical protein